MNHYVKILVMLVLGSFLFQSFQCASPEMTTGKLAIRNKDWQKAKINLEKELSKNPTNEEAILLLTQAKQELGDLLGAVETLIENEEHIKSPEFRRSLPGIKWQLWSDCFNEGVEYFNRYYDKNDIRYIDTSILLFQAGLRVRPTQIEFYRLLGAAYEIKGDTAKALESYSKYSEYLRPEINFARDKGIYIDMSRDNALAILGKPLNSRGLRNCPECDSIIIDELKYGIKDLYLFSHQRGNEAFKVKGWKVGSAPGVHELEKRQPIMLNVTPFFSLAQIYYDNKEYQKSVSALFDILTLEPTNANANAALVQIYEIQGNREDALKFIEDLVKKDPNNAIFRGQYADLLQQMEKYDEAIVQYEKALELDPTLDNAIRNLAAAYKNKVVVIQKQQAEKKEKNPNYKPDRKEFEEYLLKSAEYFEKARKTFKYQNDIEVLGDLAEIYFVLDKKEEEKKIVAELKALEEIVPPEKKERYYLILLRIYDRTDNTKELQRIQEKLEQLNKR